MAKKLKRILKKRSGRNVSGKITTRHQGGREKRFLRKIDFKRDKREMEARVVSIEYAPNRGADIALLHYPDGEKRIAYVSEKVDVHERIVEARKIKLFSTEEEELAKEAQRIFRIEKATNPSTTETVDSVLQMLKAEKKRILDEREAFKKNELAEQIKQSVAAGKAGVLREYKE